MTEKKEERITSASDRTSLYAQPPFGSAFWQVSYTGEKCLVITCVLQVPYSTLLVPLETKVIVLIIIRT